MRVEASLEPKALAGLSLAVGLDATAVVSPDSNGSVRLTGLRESFDMSGKSARMRELSRVDLGAVVTLEVSEKVMRVDVDGAVLICDVLRNAEGRLRGKNRVMRLSFAGSRLGTKEAVALTVELLEKALTGCI